MVLKNRFSDVRCTMKDGCLNTIFILKYKFFQQTLSGFCIKESNIDFANIQNV